MVAVLLLMHLQGESRGQLQKNAYKEMSKVGRIYGELIRGPYRSTLSVVRDSFRLIPLLVEEGDVSIADGKGLEHPVDTH